MKTTTHAGAAAFQPPCETANFKGGWKAAPPSSRGVAILMVIAVLAALMAIAAPFVFSMLQHGRSARNGVNQAVAHEGAQAAIDHSINQQINKRLPWFLIADG